MQKLDCAEFGSCRICIVENMDNLDFAEFRLCRNWMLQNCLSHCAYVQHWYLKDSFCTLFFRPRTCPRAFLQSFALYFLCSKAKDCRNVLGRVLGRKNKVHAPSFSQRYTYRVLKWNSYFYVSGQSRPFWAALRLLKFKYERVWSFGPQLGGSWQISGFPMR